MARNFFVSGETMVSVRANSNTNLATRTQLGLSAKNIKITLNSYFRDCIKKLPSGDMTVIDVEFLTSDAVIKMDLIDFDERVLRECISLSNGGVAEGELPLVPVGLEYIELYLASPVQQLPWRFPCSYIQGPVVWPVGRERSVVELTWRAIPHLVDDSTRVLLYDREV